jgi:RNA polymerase sigma factor (sigma-70 family)
MSTSLPPADAATVVAARRGDPAAWRALHERYERLISSVARAHRLGHHDVEDVRQTTWLRAVEHLDRLHEPACIGPWLASIARRECLRVLRGAARVHACDQEVIERQADVAPPPDSELLATERREAVRGAITTLPHRDRRLLGLLFDEQEPSYAEIGQTLRMPVGSIGPTRARVLERLRRTGPLAGLADAA